MTTKLLARNLAALGWSEESLDGDPGGHWREVQEDHGPALLVSDGRDGWLRLHSARDPLGEARRWVAREFDERPIPEVVAVLGSGSGFVVDALEGIAPHTTVLVIEPSPFLVRRLLSRRDWSARIGEKRLHLFVGPAYEPSAEGRAALESCATMPVYLVHPVLARCFPDRLRSAQEQVERLRFGLAANAEARRQFAAPYLLNTLRNLPALIEEADAGSLDGVFDGRPLLLAAAGPSLDDNLPIIARLRDRAALVCVDTALRPLMQAGMAPDLIVAVDPSEMNARHLAGIEVDDRSFLVAEASLEPRALEAFRGRTFFYRVGSHHPWPWLIGHGVTSCQLRAWGSVLVTAIDLAFRTRAEPVVLFGADLAFTHDRSHCRGVAHEEVWALHGFDRDQASRFALESGRAATCRGPSGSEVRTLPHLLEFRNWILEHGLAARTVVNATGAGLLYGTGIRLDDPKELVASHEPFDSTPLIRVRHRARTSTALPRADEHVRRAWLDEVPGLSAEALWAVERDGASARHGARPPRATANEPVVVAAIHAVMQRRPLPSWSREALMATSAPGGSLETCLQRAYASLRRLLDEQRVTTAIRPAARALLETFGGTAPVSVLFAVSDELTSVLQEFEQCVAHIAARVESPVLTSWTAPAPLGPNALARSRSVPWTRPSTLTDLASLERADAFARWLLVRSYANVAALIGPRGAEAIGQPLEELLHTLADDDVVLTPEAAELVVLSVTTDASMKLAAHAGFEPWMFGQALTGTLVFPMALAQRLQRHKERGADIADPREVFFQRTHTRMRFVNLTHHRGLPHCLHVSPLDEARILATPYDSTRGWQISESGGFCPDDVEWPLKVNGVLVEGRNRIAWGHEDGGVVNWWDGGECRRQIRVPQRISRGALDSRGLVCSSFSGDVVSFSADREQAVTFAVGMPGTAVTIDGHVVIAQVQVGEDGRLDRQLDGRSWRRAPNGWTPEISGPLGTIWGVARRPGITATAHPNADTVVLQVEGLPTAHLAVYYPTCIAWAGQSLVVTTVDGDVLLFERLVERIRQMANRALKPARAPVRDQSDV